MFLLNLNAAIFLRANLRVSYHKNSVFEGRAIGRPQASVRSMVPLSRVYL